MVEARSEVAWTEARRDMEKFGERVKAGARAIGEKITHPEKDAGLEYEKRSQRSKPGRGNLN